jgi:hypothetical protein
MLMHPGMPVMSGEVTRRAALRGDGLLRMSIGMTENRRVTRTGVKNTCCYNLSGESLGSSTEEGRDKLR